MKRHRKKISKYQESLLAEAMYRYIDPRSPEYDPVFAAEITDLVGPETPTERRDREDYITNLYGYGVPVRVQPDPVIPSTIVRPDGYFNLRPE